MVTNYYYDGGRSVGCVNVGAMPFPFIGQTKRRKATAKIKSRAKARAAFKLKKKLKRKNTKGKK